MKWTVPFLCFVFCAEVVAFFCRFPSDYKLNNQINDITGIAESIFYPYLFYHFTVSGGFKKFSIGVAVAGCLLYTTGFLFYNSDSSFLVISILTSGFLMIILSCWFMLIIFTDDKKTSLALEPGFWISAGVTSFFAGSSIVFCLHDYIVNHDLTFLNVRLYRFVPRVLSVILYSCISISVILCKKKTKISLRPY